MGQDGARGARDSFETLTMLKKLDIDTDSEVARFFTQVHHALVRINLATGKALIIHSYIADEVGGLYRWDDYLTTHTQAYVEASDQPRAIQNFCVRALKKNALSGQELCVMDFAACGLTSRREHISLISYIPPGHKNIAYFCVRSTVNNSIDSSIINQFVYQNSDFFLYIDATNNSYIRFSGERCGTALPPSSTNYARDLRAYILSHVVEEDQALVLRELELGHMVRHLDRDGTNSFTYGVTAPDGYRRKKVTYYYHDAATHMILLARTDITDIYNEMVEKQNKLTAALALAQTDPLTGLYNMRATMDRVNAACAAKGHIHALLFIDLDNFKAINDTLGHATGDEVLRAVADILRENTPVDGITGRVGGDEFVLLTRCENIAAIKRLASSINAALHDVPLGDSGRTLSGSVGIALSPTDGTSYYDLLKTADGKLYRAKAAGKNQYCV